MALIAALCNTACSSKPDYIASSHTFSGTGSKTSYVVSHGWHTGIVVPSQDVFPAIPELEHRFKDTRFIEFGWGDKGFYQAEYISPVLAARALFSPTEAVVHAVGMNTEATIFFPESEVEMLLLSDAEMQRLMQFVAASFARDSNGSLIATKPGIYGNSQFYQGVGDYYFMSTCNKWTAKGLKSIGMDLSPTFKLTASSVMQYIKKYKEQAAQSKTRQNSHVTNSQ